MPIKLSVLLGAIEAMKAVEILFPDTDPQVLGRIKADLCVARIHLKVAIGDIEMIVTNDCSP